jgi:hypothetical protein
MRRLPGFKDLVRDFGLVDYWRNQETGVTTASLLGIMILCVNDINYK